MKKNILLLLGVLVLVVAVALFLREPFRRSLPEPAATSTPNQVGKPSLDTGHNLGESKTIQGLTITPLEVVEDSRCAQGVQCIWAGTVKVRAQIAGALNGIETLELGAPLSKGGRVIELVSVSPAPMAGKQILDADYAFVFEVKDAPQPVAKDCFVGGCSGQICSDQPDAVSTCEWTEAYACYQTAKCERQASGQCGWTETAELQMCLSAAE